MKNLILDALKAAEAVFDDFDSTVWPQSERDQYYGEEGSCPVDYIEAQAKVAAAIKELSRNE